MNQLCGKAIPKTRVTRREETWTWVSELDFLVTHSVSKVLSSLEVEVEVVVAVVVVWNLCMSCETPSSLGKKEREEDRLE